MNEVGQMAIYELTKDGIRQIEESKFAELGFSERGDLQRLLRQQVDVISPDTLVIAEEFGDWQDSRRRIDLLGLDKEANLVVVELKRTEDGGHMELQAIRYAAMVSTMTFETAIAEKGAVRVAKPVHCGAGRPESGSSRRLLQDGDRVIYVPSAVLCLLHVVSTSRTEAQPRGEGSPQDAC